MTIIVLIFIYNDTYNLRGVFMEKSIIQSFGKVIVPKKEKNARADYYSVSESLKLFIFCIAGFLCGRNALFSVFNPMGTAYLSTFFSEGTSFYFVLLSTFLGFFLGDGKILSFKYVLCFILSLGANIIFGGRGKKLPLWGKAFLGSSSLFISAVIYSVLNGGSKYLLVMAAIEGILVLAATFVLGKGISVLNKDMKRKVLTNEEIISIAVLLAASVSGLGNLSLGPINVKIAAVTLIILICAFRGGAAVGAAAGSLMGFMLMITDGGSAGLFCVLSISGLFCGIMKDMGRLLTFLSFLTGAVIVSFYLEKDLLSSSLVLGTAFAGGFFFLLPKRFFGILNTFSCSQKIQTENDYFLKMKEMTVSKIFEVSKAFNSLGKVFKKDSQQRSNLTQKEVSKLIDEVAAKVCKNCGLCTYCWETDFYNTYQTIFSALNFCEKKGKINMKDISDEFKNNCTKVEEFLDAVNRTYEIYKSNMLWENKLQESRELVSQQLFAVSEIMRSISKEIDSKIMFNEELETILREEFKMRQIDISKISVLANEKGCSEVILSHQGCFGKKDCINLIIPVVNNVLGKKMRKQKSGCVTNKDGECVLRLQEETRFKLTTGVAMASKDESLVSGDSHTFMELSDGNYLLALSDGMGSGKPANRESTATIELLEQFMECGFEKDLAVKLINSVLILKSADESFSTLDICSVNLYSGHAEFIKIGAASAFLIRNNSVSIIRSSTLPVGVINNVEVEKNDMLLKNGDIIILATDGVSDIIENKEQNGKWLEEIFLELRSRNPQDIAEYILMKAKKENKNEPQDDMTVLAARFWEK